MTFERFRHSGKVCSGDYDYYLYQGRIRDEVAQSYDPFYIKSDGEMLRWYVMFFAWAWSSTCCCFQCVFACYTGVAGYLENSIYNRIQAPGFEQKMKQYMERQKQR